MFYFDTKDLQAVLTVGDKSGKPLSEVDLTQGNIVTLDKPGRYVCTLTSKSGSGHWFCVLLGGREWDK